MAKTAELFGASCEVGAIIAEKSDAVCADVKKFGVTLGKIFQISDDALDYFGNPEVTGKNIGDDFSEGKVTFPIILLYEELDFEEKRRIADIMSSDSKTRADFHYILNLLERHQIYLKIKDYISILVNLAESVLNKIDGDAEYKNYLCQMIEFAVSRSH